MAEHEEQAAFIEWARANAGTWFELEWLFSIPNGAALPKRTGSGGQVYCAQIHRLKAEGLVTGVSDLFLPAARGEYHGLFIEFKYGKNGLTNDQRAFQEAINRFGYLGLTCWTAEQAIDATTRYLMIRKGSPCGTK